MIVYYPSMKSELITGAVGTSISAVGTGLQTNDVLQTISLVITIIGGIITFIVVPLVNWYSKAKQDGKIDKEELKDGVNIIIDGSQEIKDAIDEKRKDN